MHFHDKTEAEYLLNIGNELIVRQQTGRGTKILKISDSLGVKTLLGKKKKKKNGKVSRSSTTTAI